MPSKRKVPISTARKQLFRLAELVRQGPGDEAVVLEQRGGVEPVALVRAARLAYLEERVKQLEKPGGAPFTLKGSLTAGVAEDDLERALREIRLAWGGGTMPNATPPSPRRKPRR